MLQEILELVKTWNGVGQFFFVIIIATLGTLVLMAATALIGEFINSTLPLIIRGHPKKDDIEE